MRTHDVVAIIVALFCLLVSFFKGVTLAVLHPQLWDASVLRGHNYDIYLLSSKCFIDVYFKIEVWVVLFSLLLLGIRTFAWKCCITKKIVAILYSVKNVIMLSLLLVIPVLFLYIRYVSGALLEVGEGAIHSKCMSFLLDSYAFASVLYCVIVSSFGVLLAKLGDSKKNHRSVE
jgi:hypothetical protein